MSPYVRRRVVDFAPAPPGRRALFLDAEEPRIGWSLPVAGWLSEVWLSKHDDPEDRRVVAGVVDPVGADVVALDSRFYPTFFTVVGPDEPDPEQEVIDEAFASQREQQRERELRIAEARAGANGRPVA